MTDELMRNEKVKKSEKSESERKKAVEQGRTTRLALPIMNKINFKVQGLVFGNANAN